MPHLRFVTFTAAALVLAACSTANVMATSAENPKVQTASEAHNTSSKAQNRNADLFSQVHKTDDHSKDGPRPYDKEADARADIDKALETAQQNEKMTIVAMGANWCHDSRGLAAQFEKERFLTLFKDHYELVYVDVGQKNRNIDIAKEFGVDNIVGTPTVFIVSPEGEVLNLDTAPTWRNAYSRSEDEIFDYFEGFTKSDTP